jgi:hypothetical protein
MLELAASAAGTRLITASAREATLQLSLLSCQEKHDGDRRTFGSQFRRHDPHRLVDVGKKSLAKKTAPLFAQSRAVGLQCIVNPHARPAILLLKLHSQAKEIQSNERWFTPLPAKGRFREALGLDVLAGELPSPFLGSPVAPLNCCQSRYGYLAEGFSSTALRSPAFVCCVFLNHSRPFD